MPTRILRGDLTHNAISVLPSAQKINLVIPFHNERCLLPTLLEAIQGLGERLAIRGLRVEAVLIDDGSDDAGDLVVRAWCAGHTATFDVRLIRLSRNFGKEYALSAGLDAADGDAVVTMDADLQHPVEVVDQMVDVWAGEDIDVVYAYRKRAEREGVVRRLGRAAFYHLINATSDATLEPHAGDFRLMSRRACAALRAFGERERLMKGLYGLIGFPTKGISYTQPARAAGATKFPPLKLWAMGLDGITSFSVFPLRLTLFMGLALGLLAFGYGVETIIEKLVFGIHVPGYPTLIVIICMVGAGQLIGMGVLGEYLGKVLGEVKRRPLYLVQSDERVAVAAASQDLQRSA